MTTTTTTTTPAPQIRARRQTALAAAEADVARATTRVAELEELARGDLPRDVRRNRLQDQDVTGTALEDELDAQDQRLRSLPPDLAFAREQLAKAARAAAGWRLALTQPHAKIRLVARARIAAGYGLHRFVVSPGETFSLPDEVAFPLIESGDAEVVDVAPLSKSAQRGSQKIRADLAIIDERRQRRREALAEAEAELSTANASVREMHAAQELDGDKVAPGQLAKAEARASECERNVRAKRAALEVEHERTEGDRQQLEAALAEAIAHEAEEARLAEETAREADAIQRRTRTLRAFAELSNALASEEEFGGDLTVYAPFDLRGTIEALRADPLSKIALAQVADGS